LEVLSEGPGEEAGKSAAEWDDILNLDCVERACQDFLVSENAADFIADFANQICHISTAQGTVESTDLRCLVVPDELGGPMFVEVVRVARA